ncbi:MAG: hypothetical protein WCP85_23295 [Mariniphaga sp.]
MAIPNLPAPTKNMLWIAPQTFMRVVIPVRKELSTFPELRARTVLKVTL